MMGKKREIAAARKRVASFARFVYPYFVQHGWTWGNSKTPPTRMQISKCLREMLTALSERDTVCVRTGRLRVELEQDDGYCIGVSMSAEIER